MNLSSIHCLEVMQNNNRSSLVKKNYNIKPPKQTNLKTTPPPQKKKNNQQTQNQKNFTFPSLQHARLIFNLKWLKPDVGKTEQAPRVLAHDNGQREVSEVLVRLTLPFNSWLNTQEYCSISAFLLPRSLSFS